ncbi:MAG: ATP-binding protein [Phycisphaeraceae bacterium]
MERRARQWTTAAGVAVGVFAVTSLSAMAQGGAAMQTTEWRGAFYALMAMLLLVAAACAVILMRVRQHVQRVTREHDHLMRSMISRRNELEAAMSSMIEGVLAVGMDRRVISLNDAAAKLLEARPDRATGRDMHEVIRAEPLQRFIERSLHAEKPIQDDINLAVSSDRAVGSNGARHRLYQIQGTVLRNAEGERVGSLIVLHDVTRLRRLEVVRQDFVANASHEIKTPVTAIKAAAETLLEASEENSDPQEMRQFVKMIARQSDRLQAIVEDLLSLARLEQDTQSDRVGLEPGRVAAVVQAAVETCAVRADERNTTLQWHCPADLVVDIHVRLLEQAVINLLDNAIKYSPEGATVRTVVERLGDELIISVQDSGVGIAAEHLPRIFERFYRTDKARSRAMGGTGLGLSIVKHIALAHGGRVSVNSRPGEGSTFRIHLSVGVNDPHEKPLAGGARAE